MNVNANELRRLRRERGWSIQQLADRAGVAYTTMRAMEPSSAQEATVKKVADALGVPVRDLDGDHADRERDAALAAVS